MPIRRAPRSDGIVLDPSEVLLWTPGRPERVGSWSFASPRTLHVGQGVDLVQPRATTGRSFPASCFARSATPRAVELAAYEVDAELASLLARLTAHLPAVTVLTDEEDPAGAAARAFSRGARVVFLTGGAPGGNEEEDEGADDADAADAEGDTPRAPSHIFRSRAEADAAE